MTSAAPLAPLYPPSQPYDCTELAVSSGHRLHVEQWGTATGIPALVLHGGPGSGCTPAMARFFDPERYRVILLDQRGAGRSQPHGCREDNTTALLLDDLETLRRHLAVDRWLLLGGSWGGTLGVLAAAANPAGTAGLLLRNPFLARQQDVTWFFEEARPFHADAWRHWQVLGVPEQPGAMEPWLEQRLATGDDAERSALALAWWHWENALARTTETATPPAADTLPRLANKYRLQLHYFRQGCFLETDAVLRAATCLGKVPTLILQGRQDHVCPGSETERLHQALPNSRLQWIDGVGHDPYAPAMADATVRALDHYASTGTFITP